MDERKNKRMHCVYFLWDGGTRSYIGYSNNVFKRYRTHALKLKASAQATKSFRACHLLAYIAGFPSERAALSFEWYAKRKRHASHHEAMMFHSVHPRLRTFFAPLTLPKFRGDRLTLHVRDHLDLCRPLQAFYRHDALPITAEDLALQKTVRT